MPQRNAASQIWPHLQTGEPSKTQRRGSDLASLMYPTQTKSAKAAQARRERDRAALLKALREINGRR